MIKKCLLFITTAFLLFPLSAIAQNTLSQCEYWIDRGQHHISQFHTNDNETIEFTISVNELGLYHGLHNLYYRIEDNQGVFGPVNSWMFMNIARLDSTTAVSECEYWFDDKAPLRTKISGDNVNLAIDASSLSDGMHAFNYRFINSEGISSLANSWMFAKLAVTDTARHIVSGEYWLDNDFGNRTSVSIADSCLTFSADASKLAQGLHTLNYRLKDSHGVYEAASSWMFMNIAHLDSTTTVSECEYWFDDKTPLRTKVSSDNVNLAIDASSLSDGMHAFNYRFINSEGIFSLANSWMFAKLAVADTTMQIVSGEYWLDNDFENRTAVSVSDNSLIFSADASKLAQGLHTLNCRLKDSHGVYEAASSWMFMNIAHLDNTTTVSECEYWFDDKTPLRTKVSSDNVNLAIDASSLSDGMHTFNYRFINSDGRSSLANSWMFAKLAVADTTIQIVSGEYWIDNDFENRVSVSIADNNFTFSADASGLTKGLHTLNYRLRDSHGVYDATSSWMFVNTIKEDSILFPISCEFWFDNDYLTCKSFETNEEGISFTADASHLSDGFHTLSYRMVSDTICGNIHTWSFFKNTAKQASSLAYCKYWWNSHADKAIIEKELADNEEYLWIKELIVPDFAMNDESVVNSTATLNIIFVDNLGNSSPLVAIDVAYPDKRAPITTVQIVEMTDSDIKLEWKADEDQIQFYNVYVSEDRKPFILWMPNTTATSATFKTKDGISYRFLVTARDKAGNMEKYDETKCITIK